jgi:hypothetical protein
MELIKTVKYFVSGSDKYFDIYRCVVSTVETDKDSKDRQQIIIKLSTGETYKGLHNKWVYDFLCDNEGEESFVVLWKSPKGQHMLAYSADIWKDHLAGTTGHDITEVEQIESTSSGDSFLYLWTNTSNGRLYLGKHKGSPDDGYVASSTKFLFEYDQNPSTWVRSILAFGSENKILQIETEMLKLLNVMSNPLYYNLSTNLK